MESNFIEKKLQHRCFPVNIANFLIITFFIEHLRWLFLLKIVKKTVRTVYKRGKVKHELRIQIHELRTQTHELRVLIYELEH